MPDIDADRPNILWICTDQQRFDTHGCYGNPHVRTPAIDAFSGSGTLFEHAYCQSPVCTPSRASFLTGRYPRTTRTRQNGQSIPADEVLVSKTLADAGYTCGLAGKLHVSASHPDAAPVIERRIDDGYADFHWSHDTEPLWPTNEYFSWLKQEGVTYERRPLEGSEHVQVSSPASHHHTTWCAEKAIAFMEMQAEFDRPWMFSVNIYDPHHPFDPPLEYLQPYLERLDEVPLPNYVPGELDDKPVFQRNDHYRAYNTSGYFPAAEMPDDEHRLLRAAYWAMIDLVDVQVGRMLDALEATGQRENTIVVFMSDHGEMLGDHGLYLKGPYFYDPAIRVPLIVSWPGKIREGVRSEALVELADLAPTLLDAAGIAVPERMQGRSLWPLLTGQTDAGSHRDDIYCEYYNAKPWHKDPAAHATCVRTRTHKLVVVHGLAEGELYDLRADPSETRNLWNDPDAREAKMDMLVRLADRMAWTVDPWPPREANW